MDQSSVVKAFPSGEGSLVMWLIQISLDQDAPFTGKLVISWLDCKSPLLAEGGGRGIGGCWTVSH